MTVFSGMYNGFYVDASRFLLPSGQTFFQIKVLGKEVEGDFTVPATTFKEAVSTILSSI